MQIGVEMCENNDLGTLLDRIQVDGTRRCGGNAATQKTRRHYRVMVHCVRSFTLSISNALLFHVRMAQPSWCVCLTCYY